METALGLRHGPAPGHKRLRLDVAYCGTSWRGWQSQAGGGAVQDELVAAFQKAIGANVRVHGSGRTDAGVHALGQVAHADVPESARLSDEAWRRALNARLPETIRVLAVADAPPEFHARFDAAGKVYRYRIWRLRLPSPFEAERAWHIHGPLDMEALRWSLDRLVGTHNFVRLSANRGDLPETERRQRPDKTTRTITRAEMREDGDVLEFEFEGNGFLYKMVRLIVGSLMHVARGREPKEWFAGLVDDP
ncbi:MAG: tRNA pseudouridine(38-40) synthase TruA, partial [Verrucomicrobiae bacterium]|nr:tRNA pseudouridine(38-40) synthase TruA [Verrucomicrobiae bacterium]